MANTPKSPHLSFKGFKIPVCFMKSLKRFVVAAIPAIIALLVTNNIITAGIAGLIVPILLNVAEYYFREYN